MARTLARGPRETGGRNVEIPLPVRNVCGVESAMSDAFDRVLANGPGRRVWKNGSLQRGDGSQKLRTAQFLRTTQPASRYSVVQPAVASRAAVGDSVGKYAQ